MTLKYFTIWSLVRRAAIHGCKDKEAAFHLFTETASLGHSKSIFALKKCYQRGW
jgi:TPR repeat protein